MIKSKAIDIIQTFDAKEFNEFGKFVNSPFFNSNNKLIDLYLLLKKNYPEFSKKNFTKEDIYSKLFPGRKYNDGTMRKLLSGMQSLAEEYHSHSALNSNYSFYKKLFLLIKLDEKKLDVIFNMHLNDIYKNYELGGRFDDVFFRNNFEIYEALLNHLASKGTFDKDIEIKCFFYLISHCIILSLKMNQDLMVGTISHSFNYKDTLIYKFIEQFDIQNFIEEIKIYSPQVYPVLKIYYLNFLILSDGDKDDNFFWEMKKLVWENIEKFSRFEKYNLMLFLENGASLKIKDGKLEFVSHIHEIHKKMLEDNIYESDDKEYLHFIRFWKIVSNALRLKEFEWTKNFIERYSQKLHPEYLKHMKNYSFAMLYFEMGEFDKALVLASKVKAPLFNIRYDLMVLRVKCYCELNMFEELYYQMDSFKHLLKKDSSPDWAKKRFQNFIIYFDRFLKLRENENIDGLDFLKKELSGNLEIFDSIWLSKKIDEILTKEKLHQ